MSGIGPPEGEDQDLPKGKRQGLPEEDYEVLSRRKFSKRNNDASNSSGYVDA